MKAAKSLNDCMKETTPGQAGWAGWQTPPDKTCGECRYLERYDGARALLAVSVSLIRVSIRYARSLSGAFIALPRNNGRRGRYRGGCVCRCGP